MRQIDPSERWLIVGTTGSGKSTAAKWLLLHYPQPIVIIDSKRSGFPSVPPDSVESAIGKIKRKFRKQPKIIRITPDKAEADDLEAVYDTCLDKGDMVIVEDEALLIPISEGRKFAFVTGRSEGVGIISCTQRPFGVIREAISESERKWEFLLHDRKDKQRIAEFSGIPTDLELERYQSAYYDSTEGRMHIFDPLDNKDYDNMIAAKFIGQ